MSSDKLPILSEEQVTAGEDDPDTVKFQELPPPYSEKDEHDRELGSPVPKQDSVESADLPLLMVYTRRWYILGLFCLLACHQCIVWNTWGPIETGVQFAYGWSNSTAPMMANWGTIMFCISVVPLSKLVEYDVRTTVLLVSGMIALGTVLRCCRLVTHNPTVFLVSCHLCAILNGISGVTIMAAPPLISSQWFPPGERTLATSINLASNMLGNGLSMFLGPALVHLTSNTTGNTSTTSLHFTSYQLTPNVTNGTSQSAVRHDIDTYMQIHAGVAVFLFGLFFIYFPSKPPHPPAPSSAIERTEFWAGIKALLSNRNVLLACFAYSVSQGVMGSWLGVLVNNFRPLGVTDQQIGLMGLFSVIGQCCLSMCFGFITDRLKNCMKLILLLFLVLATGAFVWLMLMCLQVVPHSLTSLYTAVILATSINFSCIPLFFEMTVEIAYPVNEGLVGGFLTAFYNFTGIIFFFLFFIPNIGYVWINYLLVASTALAIPAVLATKETYNRSNVDEVALNTNS
eukprot:GFUD01014343.1.p1 GENE.GFUD01014343.1~~GFUD01014343.1.p1  ORF type:complete len:513 (-),score=93.41 GFUD01014343.1:87-1625(-)